MASLPTPDVVLKVATGPNGVIEGKRVRRFVDLSTTGATMAQRIFTLLAARNIVQIDSPVSGGVVGAKKARWRSWPRDRSLRSRRSSRRSQSSARFSFSGNVRAQGRR